MPVLGEESEEVWLTEAVVGVVEVAGPLVVQGRRELLAVSLAGGEAVVLADHLEVVSLVLAAHQVVLHLVAAGDVAQVLDLELLQQVLLGDAGQQLGLAAEVVAVLVIVLVQVGVQRQHHREPRPAPHPVVVVEALVERLRVPDALVLAQNDAVAANPRVVYI